MHRVRDGLPVAEDLGEVPGAEHVPQRGGGQQPGGPVVVVVVADRAQRVGHLAQEEAVSDSSGVAQCSPGSRPRRPR